MVAFDPEKFEAAKQATINKWYKLKADLVDWMEETRSRCGICNLMQEYHKVFCPECPAWHLCHKDGSHLDKIRSCSRELYGLVVQLLEELAQLKSDG